ncbi:MAG: diguanylate cyclase [Gammaproteobacteria bacterium]|nr:MAG: diguanylate cyclase [Gammaproteobacteria bacterium]
MSDTKPFIHHIAITAPASVLKDVINFYGQILGLKPGPRPDMGGIKGVWLYAGENPIIHLVENENRQKNSPSYFDHVALRCTDLNGVIAKLESNNIKYGQFERQDQNQLQLFMKDPAGVFIELNFDTRMEP